MSSQPLDPPARPPTTFIPPRAVSHPQITVTLLAGLDQGRLHRVDRPTTTFGRSATCEVVLRDPLVSRHHCQILLGMGGATVKDLGSAQGTFLNGLRITEAPIQHQDVVSLGDTRFRFSVEIVQDPGGERAARVDELAHKKLLALYEIGNLVNSALELKTLSNIILSMAIRAIQANRGFLLVRQADGEMAPLATHSLSPGEAQAPYSQALVDSVLREKIPVLVLDALNDVRFGERENLKGLPLASAICVPIWEREAVAGVIYVDKARGTHPFTEEDLYFLSAFANQAVVAILNAR